MHHYASMGDGTNPADAVVQSGDWLRWTKKERIRIQVPEMSGQRFKMPNLHQPCPVLKETFKRFYLLLIRMTL